DLFDRSVELLVFPAEFLRWIVVDHDVGINAVTFDDPFFSVFREGRELRPEELAAVRQGQRIANPNDSTPGPFPDQFAETVRFESVRKNVAVRGRELIAQGDHRPE